MMVALEEAPQFSHLHEVNFLLLHLPLEPQAILEGTELLDQLQSLLVVFLHAGGDLPLLWVGVEVQRSMSWSNSSTVRSSSLQ